MWTFPLLSAFVQILEKLEDRRVERLNFIRWKLDELKEDLKPMLREDLLQSGDMKSSK